MTARMRVRRVIRPAATVAMAGMLVLALAACGPPKGGETAASDTRRDLGGSHGS